MRCSVLVALLSTLSSIAAADAIGPAPACPPGSRGDYAHEGEWCVPWPCTDDSACEGGHCRPWRVCTKTTQVQPGGLRPTPAPMERRELVVGTCDPSRRCSGTEEPPPSIVGTLEPGASRCVEASFCVPDALPELPSDEAPPAQEHETPQPSTPARPASCGCHTPGAVGQASAWLACALFVFVWRRR